MERNEKWKMGHAKDRWVRSFPIKTMLIHALAVEARRSVWKIGRQ